MFGIDDALIGVVAGGLINNLFADERQSDQQQFNAGQQQNAQFFNSAEAAANRDFQERMSNSAYQRQVKDLNAAGLNPMLSFMHSGASTPSGGQASVGPASSGIASPGNNFDFPAALQTASNIKLQEATKDKTNAETDRAKAEADEIRARTPTHAANIEQIGQNIEESRNRIQKIIQETSTSASSAANIAQQTVNLQALLPQIRATIDQLEAHTRLSTAEIPRAWAQEKQATAEAGRAHAATGELNQRIAANLPALEAAYKRLQNVQQQMSMPQHSQQEMVSDSFIGSLSATLKALNPLQGFLK